MKSHKVRSRANMQIGVNEQGWGWKGAGRPIAIACRVDGRRGFRMHAAWNSPLDMFTRLLVLTEEKNFLLPQPWQHTSWGTED